MGCAGQGCGGCQRLASPLSLQEKLTKSLAYILSSQDTVQTQIAELEETVKHTEVRAEGAHLSLSCP